MELMVYTARNRKEYQRTEMRGLGSDTEKLFAHLHKASQ